MQYYFKLQFQIINRRLSEAGVYPLLGMLLAGIGFVLLSMYLFFKTEFAAYLYGVIALASLSKLGEKHRNDFLKSIFSGRAYYQVRLLENVLLALPFLLYLLYEMCFVLALGLLPMAVLLVLVSSGDKWNFTIPTPFGRYPFEYTVGFRQAWLVYSLAFFLAYKSIEIQNFGLGVFALILVFLTGMAHYLKPESQYFVWVYKASPKVFLFKKIGTALLYSSLLCLPIFFALCYAFQGDWLILAGVLGLGYIFLSTMVLAKYAAFPGDLNLPQAILFGLSFWFPPMLLILIPIFYQQAIKRLNPILT